MQVLRRTWHAQPSPVFLGGTNPHVQARHSACRQVPLALLAQTYFLPVLFGCHHARGPLLPCLCVPWPLPAFAQGGAHQSGPYGQPVSISVPPPMVFSPSHLNLLAYIPLWGSFLAHHLQISCFSPEPPTLCHETLLLPFSLLHGLSSISFRRWHCQPPPLSPLPTAASCMLTVAHEAAPTPSQPPPLEKLISSSACQRLYPATQNCGCCHPAQGW